MRKRRGASRSLGGRGGRALHWERGLHHQLHAHLPQRAVGVRGHVAVGHQLIAVSEVPDEVDGGGGFQVAAGVVELDLEDHVLTAEEDVFGLAARSLLGDADRHWDLI